MGLFWRRARRTRAEFPHVDPATSTDQGHRHELLVQLHAYVESFAAEQTAWYMANRVVRQIASLGIRFISLLFIFLGGICPLLPKDNPHLPAPDLQLGYFLIAIGGGLLLFDRLFGISAAWMRFIIAAFEIDSLLDAFRMRWVKIQLEAKDVESLDTFWALVDAADDAIG
jgi:hypothetical protein